MAAMAAILCLELRALSLIYSQSDSLAFAGYFSTTNPLCNFYVEAIYAVIAAIWHLHV